MNFGSAFIKLFQIIEILGKFLFLPIWYKGLLLDIIYSVAQIGELIELDADFIIKTDSVTGGTKDRYWTKFTVYEEYSNVLQAVPLSSLALFVSITILNLTYLGGDDSLWNFHALEQIYEVQTRRESKGNITPDPYYNNGNGHG